MKPQYGFEHKGHEAIGNVVAVPPNATLMVSLELVSWKVIDEITDDKKVLKKIQKQGDGYEKPNNGVIVAVGREFADYIIKTIDNIDKVIDQKETAESLPDLEDNTHKKKKSLEMQLIRKRF